MFKFFFVAALVPAMAMAAVNFRACPNGAPTPASLTVNNCSGDECILVAGQALNARANGIVSPVGSASATAHIVARVAGLDVGFELPPELTNACQAGLVAGCPIVAGTAFDYVLIDDSLDAPARDIPVEIEVGLTGDNGIALACVRFDARIQ
ncbi:AAEL013835-PA [Aedes aegypti]|uniref:AAEL013835-PA n=1 Tax=Aedes aegypti TaxID=7159 RepID=Q16I08_AEDAE|nr:AAEL013835-PA [Aedes aegypti]